jgi:hypothetical protein
LLVLHYRYVYALNPLRWGASMMAFRLVCLSSVFALCNVANSQVLTTIPVHVEAGLDAGTKEFLSQLPQEIRKQFEMAIDHALDRLDFSVDSYIAELQDAAIKTTAEVSCTTQGALINTRNELSGGILSFLFGDSSLWAKNEKFVTPKGVDSSSQALLQATTTTRGQITKDTDVARMVAIYSDLAFDAAKLHCQLQSVKAPTDFPDSRLKINRKALSEWELLETTNSCSKAGECVPSRTTDIKKIMVWEDQRLIDAASVRGQFDQLIGTLQADVPPETTWSTYFRRVMALVGVSSSNTYDLSKDEATLFGLRTIELKISALKGNWQWRASKEWTNAKALLDPVPNQLKGIAEEMNPGANGHNLVIDSESAFNNLRRLKAQLNSARSSLLSAKALDPRLDEAVKTAMISENALESDAANKVEQICTIYLSRHGRFGFSSSFGAFDWCKANPTSRWTAFPDIQ